MRMSVFLLLAGLGLASATGCQGTCQPHTQTGWRFEVLKPALMVSGPSATAVTSSTSSGLVAMDQSTSMNALSGPAFAAAPVESSQVLDGRFRSRSRSTIVGAAPADCTLSDICAALERIERRLSTPATPAPTMSLPTLRERMPQGPAN